MNQKATFGFYSQIFHLVIICIALLCVIVLSPHLSQAAYSTQDLQGTWEFHGFSNLGQASEPNDPCADRLSLTFDATGKITQASGTDCDNTVQPLNLNGAGSLDSIGTFSMSYTNSGGIITTVSHGTMDISKTKIVSVGNDSDGYQGFGMAHKKGSGFSAENITGPWDLFFYLNLLQDELGPQIDIPSFPSRSWGMMTIDTSGNIAGTFENDFLGVRSFTGGGTLTSEGAIKVNAEDSDSDPIVLEGQVDITKSTGTFVGFHDVGPDDLNNIEGITPVGIMSIVKSGFSFTQSDLMGSWNFYSFNESTNNNTSCWERGTLVLDRSGSIVSGTIVRCDGSTAPANGGSLSTTSDGSVSGTVMFDSGSIGATTRLSITHGRIDRQKTMASGINVLERGPNFRGIIVLVKSGKNFVGQLDIDGDGQVTFLHDGMIVLRYLFGIRGEPLMQGLRSVTPSRALTADEVEANLALLRTTMLDPDCNGSNTVFTDGVQIFRYLLGLRGNALVKGIVDRSGCRTSPEEIEQFLNTFLPAAVS